MKLEISSIRFYVNEKKRTVACMIKAKVILDHGSQDTILVDGPERFGQWNGFGCTGIARCHPDDVWNEELGRKIAESKAKRAAYLRGKKELSRILKLSGVFQDDLKRAIENLTNYSDAELKYIRKLSGDEE